jgi:peptide/nickel transport system permease protein
MSSGQAAHVDAAPGAPAASGRARPRSLVQRWLLTMAGRTSARLGMIWIAVMVLAAVFAPLLANSHPLAMKVDGQWSSPMLRHLTPADVMLMMVFALCVVVLPLRVGTLRLRVCMVVLASTLAVGPVYLLVQPPLTVVYESYREDLTAGRIERAVFAPIAFSPSDRLRDQPEMRLQPPGARHLMGTTVNGADLMANMLHATRIALSIGFISTGIAIVIGVIIGGLMGYFSGIVDLLGMRLVEVFSAIPTLLLLLCFVAFFQVNLYFMMAIIGFTSWVGYALFVRAEFLRLRRMDFVQAAEGLGLPLWSILFRHMLPNGVTPVLVNASFGVAGAILAESTLSFLGIGLTEEASWGRLLNQALGVGGTFYWWIAVYPGLAIFLTVYAYNLVGEALRDVIDPHTSRGSA